MLFGLSEFSCKEVGANEKETYNEVGMDPSFFPEVLKRKREHVHELGDET